MDFRLSIISFSCFFTLLACDGSRFNYVNEKTQATAPANLDQQAHATIQSNEANAVITEETITIESCSREELVQSMTIALAFTESKNCQYGLGNNLSPKAGFMQAAEPQMITVDLSKFTEICDLKLNSESNDLHYDDYLFMTLNGFTLVASELEWAKKLNSPDGIALWDWKKLQGQEHQGVEQSPNYGMPYCYGDFGCKLPGHDDVGPFSYHLTSETIQTLKLAGLNTEQLNFSMIATGDNDADDCDHSSFDLKLEISYIE